MRSVNRDLCMNNESRMFVMLFLGLLDIKTGEVQFANAGHVIPYLLTSPGTLGPITDRRPNAPLGINAKCEYAEGRIQLQAGTTLLLYSDGIPEAAAPSGEHYTSRRLRHSLANMTSIGSEDAICLLYTSPSPRDS